jgi:hypothetical protein
LDGFAVPGHEYLPPVHPAYNSEISPYRYNVTKAKELLRLAGYVFPEPFAEIPPEFYFMLFVAGVIVLLVTVLVYLQVRRHRPGIFTTSDR